ncbi:MAG TPA: hypothetical protein VFS20_27550 [Longimicrobium sp.]|nr:hypothetical protein [Longimicrobium sp.]
MHSICSVAHFLRAAALPAALAVLAACSDGTPTTATPRAPTPGVPTAIPCTVNVRAGTLVCSGGAGGVGGVRGNRVIGGQGVNVTLTSSNVQYDSLTQTLSADVTVQNLLVQRMGSDGATESGVRVFFASAPGTTGGEGQVQVLNADSTGIFTATGQRYFIYPGALPYQGVSAARRWEFQVPKSVTTFVFQVYVHAALVPAIAFEMTADGNTDIYRMGIDGNDLTRLTTSAMNDESPTVAQGTVVFVSYRDGNAELYSMPLKGGTQTRLTSTPAVAERVPALSPDGAKLAWVQPSSGLDKVWTGNANATGAAAAVVPAIAAAIESAPEWASSTRLAFGSTAGATNDIYDLAPGGAPTLLAGGDRAEVEPAWSADGARVAFVSNRTRDTELFVLAVGTGQVTQVTTRTGSDGSPTWLADGRIVYTCAQGIQLRLCIVDPANPAGAAQISTPGDADHASAVRF